MIVLLEGKTVLCNKFQINWKNCLVSRTFLAHYFFNKFHFYCSCVYFSMLLFRVSFQLYHLLLLCKINFRHTKEKGRFSCIIQPFPVGLYSPLWVRTRCSVIRRSHTDLKTQQFQLRILHLAPNSNIRIRWNSFSEFEIPRGKCQNIGTQIYKSVPQKSQKDRQAYRNTWLKATRRNR